MDPIVHCNPNLLSLAHAPLTLLGNQQPVPKSPLHVGILLTSVQRLIPDMAHVLPSMDTLLNLLGLQRPVPGCSPHPTWVPTPPFLGTPSSLGRISVTCTRPPSCTDTMQSTSPLTAKIFHFTDCLGNNSMHFRLAVGVGRPRGLVSPLML